MALDQRRDVRVVSGEKVSLVPGHAAPPRPIIHCALGHSFSPSSVGSFQAAEKVIWR
jgi:hypothetical protein